VADAPSEEEVVVDTPVVVAEEAAIPGVGDTPAEAIDKFETFERVEASHKLL